MTQSFGRTAWVTVLLSCTAGMAQAQEVPANSIGSATADSAGPVNIGDIVVTARRREESAQTVPISLDVFSAARLTEASVQTLSDLTALSPGLRFSAEGGAGNTNVSLRGLSKLPIGEGIPAVVIYFAEAPLPSDGGNVPTYDLANIQVLKGPQGTLFGRNTLGGAILVTPQAPNYELEGYMRGILGSYDQREIEGALNLPIVQDRVSLRVAGQVRRREGFVKNLSGGPRFSNVHQDSFRASLLIEPFDGFSNTTVVDYFKAREQPAGITLLNVRPSALGPLGPVYGPGLLAALEHQRRVGPYSVFSGLDDPHLDRKTWGIVNTTSWELSDNLTLKNIFSLRRAKMSTQINTAAVDILNSAALGPLVLFHANSATNKRFLTNELQLQGDSLGGRLEWIVGGFYATDRPSGPMGSQFRQFDFLRDGPTLIYSTLLTRNTTKALFGQASIDLSDVLTDGLKLNLGYRHTWDKVSNCGGGSPTHYFSEKECRTISAQNLADGTGITSVKGNAPTYTIGLDYKVNEALFLYAQHRRGYRGVNLNSPRFETQFTTGGPGCVLAGVAVTCPDLRQYQTTNKETLDDFEIGLKSDFEVSGANLRFNVAAFHSKYKGGLQFINVRNTTGIPGTTPDAPNRGSVAVNVADITIQGVEADLVIAPSRRFSVTLGAAYTDQNIDRLNVPTIGANSLTKEKVTLPTPKFTGTIAARWELPIEPLDGRLVFNTDYYHSSEFAVQEGIKVEGYDLVNARLDWNNIANSNIDAGVFVRNLFKEKYISFPVVFVTAFPTTTAVYGEPRTVGLELRYRF